MKISEAQAKYRTYGKELMEKRKELVQQREDAKKKYELTGDVQFSDMAATLQVSIDDADARYEENSKVLEALNMQYMAIWNGEAAKQQADAIQKEGENMAKLMATARRIAHGDEVPYKDEKKLLEYNPKLYQFAKNAQMMNRREKYKKYDSLWEDEEETKEYDPEGKAANAEAAGILPEIPSEPVSGEE